MDQNTPKLIRRFVYSAGALLLAVAIVLFVSNLTAGRVIHPHDPVCNLPVPSFFWIVGGLGVVVAGICLFAQNIRLQLGFICWFATNLLVYGIGLLCLGVKAGFRGYLLTVSDAFWISCDTANLFLTLLTAYLLVGSLAALVWLRFGKAASQRAALGRIKNTCTNCGGRFEFSVQNSGQKIPCPHCQTLLDLQQDENLKISCYFCQGHIEFPAYALGTKIPCPHCRSDITLRPPRRAEPSKQGLEKV